MPDEISHSRDEETMAAKAAWFQSLSVGERMRVFVEWCGLIRAATSDIVGQKDAQSIPGRVLVVDAPRR